MSGLPRPCPETGCGPWPADKMQIEGVRVLRFKEFNPKP